LLGTYVTVSAYGADASQLNEAISAAFDEFRRVDALLSIHRPDSELSKLNERAAFEAVPVSEELFRVLELAQHIALETEGAFDVTIRPLTQLWGFIWKEYRLPEKAELNQALARVDFRNVELHKDRRTVRFLRQGVSLDFGGIGKGYAVDCAMEKLRAMGIERAMVKAGGDLRVLGLPPGESFWEVQLEDPSKRADRPVVRLREGALSTSGNYENFFVVDGQRYSHIIDPRTGLPVQGVAACTVIARTCMESDAWATACFVYGPERSLEKFGERLAMRFVLTNAKEIEPIKVQVRTSAHFHARIAD
jgi:FAD:protein FMN transferase